MAETNRLTARKVASIVTPGRYADGGGLYLRVTPKQRVWSFMFRWGGKQAEISLGNPDKVSLAEARRKADTARRSIADGIHPKSGTARVSQIPTFGDMADEYIATHAPHWRNQKHRDQWAMTLGRVRDENGRVLRTGYCKSLGNKLVSEITVDDVLAELRPIWSTKAETAFRLRGRIEAVLDAAKVRGFRSGENPAAWRGNLALILPKQSRKRRIEHHPSMPHTEVPAFVAGLRSMTTAGALALDFLILTAARSGEVRGATWREIDLAYRLWTVPKDRMKGGRPHIVPLSDAALAVLERANLVRDVLPGTDPADAYVFPGRKRGAPLSDMALTQALRRLNLDCTAHGFRSSFRDWAGDETDHSREVIEAALAHALGDATEQAYRRSTAIEKRRALMNDWAAYLSGTKP